MGKRKLLGGKSYEKEKRKRDQKEDNEQIKRKKERSVGNESKMDREI